MEPVPSGEKAGSSPTGFWRRIWNLGRMYLVISLFAVLWCVLLVYAFIVQVIRGPIYDEMGRIHHTYHEVTQGERGSILDRNGNVLARSVACQSVSANCHLMGDIDDAASKLAPLLHKKTSDLKALFAKGKGFLWIARKIDDATASEIAALRIPGIDLKREYERVYPYRNLAGQVLGFVGLDGRGLEGIERSYDTQMQGGTVEAVVPTNPADQVLRNAGRKPEELRGQDVRLTLDVQVQSIAEESIREAVLNSHAKWGGVLVSDVRKGEILAWAQYPFFNPNNYKEASSSTYRNRLAADSLEPGSTFKPILMASALEEKIVTPETSVYCEKGLWRTKYAPIRDDTHAFGYLTTTEIISHSSNIGSAKIGLKLGTQRFYSYLTKLGFGRRTGVGIHESRGILRRPRDWSELDLMSTSFGQSVSVTGVQMLQAYTVIAGGGDFRPLRLVLGDDDSAQNVEAPGTRIYSKQTTRTILKMMEETVDGNGTGTKARIPGVRVAGKTGTAQKAGPRGRGYSNKRLASFGGILPADDPKFVVYVMLDEPTTTGYGGAIAAPVFQKVASRTLAYSGYLPDVTFAAAQAKEKPLTAAQKARRDKDAAYLETLARYRAQKASKGKRPDPAGAPGASPSAMPDLAGLSLRKAMETCAGRGLVPRLEGDGAFVLRQFPPPGTKLTESMPCTVWLTDTIPERQQPEPAQPSRK